MLSNFIFSNKSLYCSPEVRIWVALRFRSLTKTVLNLKIFSVIQVIALKLQMKFIVKIKLKIITQNLIVQ